MLSEALGGTGKVILVRGANSNSVGNARADGFEAGLAEDIELVGEQQGDWSNAVAKQVAENKISMERIRLSTSPNGHSERVRSPRHWIYAKMLPTAIPPSGNRWAS